MESIKLRSLFKTAIRFAKRMDPLLGTARWAYRRLRNTSSQGNRAPDQPGRGVIKVASHKREQLLQRLREMDEETRHTLEEFENVYAGQNGREHVEAVARTHGARYFSMSALFGALRSTVGGSVLEVGCGPAVMTMVLKSEHPDLEFHGIDRYRRPIEIGKHLARYLNANIKLASLEGAELEEHFAPQYFDYVLLCEILEHLEYGEQQRAVLDAVARITKPSGRVIVTVPYEDRIPSPGHLTEFSKKMLSDLLEPYADAVLWHEEERHEYGMQNHFIVSFQLRAQTS